MSFQDTEDFNIYNIFFSLLSHFIFFTCKKSKFSRPGLQMNSHANFTYSFPQLKIILIPTIIRSNHFSFISLIACIGSPTPEILLLCDIDLLHIFLNSWNSLNKAYWCPEMLLLCDIDLLHIFLNSWNSINKAYCCF
jgi:hypothetical protein